MSAVQTKTPLPPSKKIEKQYRLSLIRRWFDFVWRTAVFSGVVTAFSTSFITLSLSTSLWGFAGGLIAFPFILYPALALRRSYIISPNKDRVKSSPFSLFLSSVLTYKAIRYITTHVLFSAGFTLLYTQVISWSNNSADFGLFKSTARHPLHLNERVAFLVWGKAIYFFSIAISDLVGAKTQASWPVKKIPMFRAAQQGLDKGFAHLLNLLPLFRWNYTLFAPLFSIVYWYFRRRVWFFTAKWGLSSFVINWARHSKTNLSIGLVAHLYALILASVVLLRLPSEIVNAYVTQPISFSAIKSPLTPDRYLLESLKSENPYNIHFTLMELLRVAHDSSRRSHIFDEPSASPSARTVLVHEIWQELLIQFGKSYKTLTTHGGTLRAPIASAPVKPSAPDPRAIQVKQADVFRPVTKQQSAIGSVLQNVLDGPVRPTPPSVLNAEQKVVAVESKALKQVEGVAREAVKRLEGYEQGRVVVKETKGIVERVYSWSGKEWARRNVQTSIPDQMIVIWLIDIFATFAVASASEDKYGYIQSVLPATLEAIVRYRSALLSLQSELLYKAQSIGKSGPAGAEEVKRLISQSTDACDRGVLRIGERFGKSLSALRLPPGVADQLSEICRPLETVEEE